MDSKMLKSVAIIVAHPDDETLWAGGTILSQPAWKCFIACLCRKSDAVRATRFHATLKMLKASGIMGDLDDGPNQNPQPEKLVEQTILDLLPAQHFDLVITHNPTGEYTRHLRHEETSRAVINLWKAGKIVADELWIFAYEDGERTKYPEPVQDADIYNVLSDEVFAKKYSLMLETYGFDDNSWEAKSTTQAEAFWQFKKPADAVKWLKKAFLKA